MPARPRGDLLPANPHPGWYRKAAKQKLAELRTTDPEATLSAAQLQLARANGFPSWRALIAAIAERRASAIPVSADGQTPLHVAAAANDVQAIRALLARGDDPEHRYREAGHTALSWAVTLGALDAASALVAGGARTDLFCAAALGDLERVRSFFNNDGSLAADAGYTCRSRFLALTKRSATSTGDRDLVSEAMYAAIRHARVEIARFLIDRPIDLRSHAFVGATLLHWAYYVGCDPIVAMLLECGASPDERDDTFRCTPRAFGICAPARLGEVALVTQRLDADPSLATINEGRGTPLHEAVRGGHGEIVRALLAHGADPFARDDAGRLPRELADADAGAWVEALS